MQSLGADETGAARVCRMARVNVEAVYRVAYTAVRHFKEQGSGFLVNMSSVVGTKVRPTAGPYAGTKHALEALSEALRLELAGSGIGVSSIEAGLVMTELHDELAVHPRDSFRIKKPLVPEDIARGVRYVLEQPEHVRISNLMILPEESPL